MKKSNWCGKGWPMVACPLSTWVVLYWLLVMIIVKLKELHIQIQIQIQKRFIETHIHIQKWYIKFLCHSKESDSSLRYINSTLDNMCINEDRQKPGSLYGPHYDAWSIPDSDITQANVDPAWDGGTHAGPTLGQVTSSSGSRILYWSYDVALVVKATTSANKTRVQLGSRWMIIKPFKDGEKPDQSEISCAILMNAVRTINRYSKLYSCKYSWCK